MTATKKNNLWGIILAGGEGVRLQRFTRLFYDHDRPKQYCAFIGSRSMVQHTIDRAKILIDQERIITIVTKKHLHFVREQIKSIMTENLIVQPFCRETAPAVLLPLLHLHHRDPHSVAVLFPSDHFILDESKFMNYVHNAKDVVAENPDITIAFGVRPDRLDHGYGWIKQGTKIHSSDEFKMYSVNSFIEKPQHDPWSTIGMSDYFWNTFVLVGKTETLLKHFQNKTPRLYESFSQVKVTQSINKKRMLINALYHKMLPTKFSTSILEKISDGLRVVDISDVYWSDWGVEHRIKNDVQRFDLILNTTNGMELVV